MCKEDYFDINGYCTETDDVILKRLQPDDKENYIHLLKEKSLLEKAGDFLDIEEYLEGIWHEIEQENAIYVSILRKPTEEYIGNLVLRYLDSETPEIGIDILKRFKRNGLAYSAMLAFMKHVQSLRDIEYFIARIYSDNIPSIGLFKKLGAVQIGKEPSEFSVFLEQLKTEQKETYSEILSEHPDTEKIVGRRSIAQYAVKYEEEND